MIYRLQTAPKMKKNEDDLAQKQVVVKKLKKVPMAEMSSGHEQRDLICTKNNHYKTINSCETEITPKTGAGA